MLNFSRQAYNEKVTDCHTLFRVLRFFELGCFLGRNIDLGGSFPKHDLKQGCISCGILVSGIGARGVSSEHMENMEMFSCSPT